MKILVTGGAGFIGSALVNRLVLDEHDVSYVDNYSLSDTRLQRARVDALCQGAKEYVADITDLASLEEIFKEGKFDAVFNLAAKPGVRESITNPFVYAKTNYDGLLNIFELGRRYGVPHIISASSSSVYGRNNTAPYQEDTNVDFPVSVYASTKRAGELLAYTYTDLHKMNITCLRFFTVYGPFGRPDMAPFIFTQKISNNEPIQVFNHGKQQRDFTFVTDIVDGCVRVLEHKNGYQIFNLGNDNPIELMDFIGVIERAVGKEAQKEFCDAQLGDVTLTHANIDRARTVLGFNPKVSIESGIEQFVSWYKEFYTVS